MSGDKYKHLNGGVKSFTEGFTGVINTGFSHLAKYARSTGDTLFTFDILQSKSIPDLSDQQPWFAWLMNYIQLETWCDQIGCRAEHIVDFTIEVRFDLKQYHSDGNEDWMPFGAFAKICDDRGKEYTHEHFGAAYILNN